MAKPVAIVTGAGSGIGEATATHLHSLGYKVVIADMNETSGQRVAAALGPDTLFHQTDVSSYTSQARLFKRAYEWGGNRLDFCHANAGIDDRQQIYAGMDEEEVDEEGLVKKLDTKTMEINLEAVIQGLWLFKYYVRRSKAAGGGKGWFVATSSAAGLYNHGPSPQYTASKYGVVGFVRSAGPNFVKDNITVNAICPAFIPTNLPPRELAAAWPKEHTTPMSTVIKAIDALLKDDTLTGQTIELSLDKIYFRKPVDYVDESSRWIGLESANYWALGARKS